MFEVEGEFPFREKKDLGNLRNLCAVVDFQKRNKTLMVSSSLVSVLTVGGVTASIPHIIMTDIHLQSKQKALSQDALLQNTSVSGASCHVTVMTTNERMIASA